MRRFYCTYFDRNYLIRGITLINSLNRHSQGKICIFAVCLDEISRLVLERLELPNTRAIPLHTFELRDLPLLAAKKNRTLVEYYWTLTPTIIQRILERNPQVDVLTYLDADLCFYAEPDPILEELGDHSVLIHEHRFPPGQAFLEKYGKYNVGLLCFRNDASGLEVLDWWRARCIEWCYAKLENGRYGDQLYLNDWPTRFRNVAVLKHIGAGVAPWNHIQYEFTCDEKGNVRVNSIPLVFYHFHSLTFVEPDIVIPTKFITNPLTLDILNYCVLPYVNALQDALDRVRKHFPDYRFGLFSPHVLTENHTFIAAKSQSGRIKNANFPHRLIPLKGSWDCYATQQLSASDKPADRIITGQAACGEMRPGLQSRFHTAVSHAKSEFTKGDPAAAILILKEFTANWPDHAPALMVLGEMLWAQGEQKAAVAHLSRARTIAPDDPNVTAKLLSMLVQAQDYDAAQRIVTDSLHGPTSVVKVQPT